jgi:hypothetical protein
MKTTGIYVFPGFSSLGKFGEQKEKKIPQKNIKKKKKFGGFLTNTI